MVLLFNVCVAKEAVPDCSSAPQILYPIKIYSKLAERKREFKDDTYNIIAIVFKTAMGFVKFKKLFCTHGLHMHTICTALILSKQPKIHVHV